MEKGGATPTDAKTYCSKLETAMSRLQLAGKAITFCRIFKFFKRSSGNLADMLTCNNAVTHNSPPNTRNAKQIGSPPSSRKP